MSWLLSTVVALLSGVLGLLAAGLVMTWCVRWYRISSFEGGAGYAVAFGAVLGGAAAAALGLVVSRFVGGEGAAGFGRGLGSALALVLAIAAASAWIARALADVPPEIDGRELTLEVEVRLPAGATPSPKDGRGESYLELGSVVDHVRRRAERGELRPADARLEAGRWIVPGAVHVFASRGLRSIDVHLDGEAVGGFIVPLPARPGRESEDWSEWEPRPKPPNEPWPATRPSYRFRVVPIEPPPPGPTQQEVEAAAAAARQAEFDATDPGAPVAQWLRWTRYGAPEEMKAAAVRHIVSRATFVEELRALMRSPDTETAVDALRVVESVPNPPKELVGPGEEAGRDLVALIRRVNATTPEEDPSYQGAAEVSQRFGAWMAAVRTLRERCGADLTPVLREILELSRVRSDSVVMRGDVLRVASHFMQEWTGLEPLPTDPKPR